MTALRSGLAGAGLALWCALSAAAGQAGCTDGELAVQVLGSGGPVPDDVRASTGYLVWVRGKSRLLVDAGGGTLRRFAQAHASIADLDLIAISHLHPDHIVDFPEILKTGIVSPRTRALPVSGPSAAPGLPDIDELVRRLFEPKGGALSYLSGFLDGTGGLFPLQVMVVDATPGKVQPVLKGKHLQVDAMGVSHGGVPRLAYRVSSGGKRIVFSADQNDYDSEFRRFVAGAELLMIDYSVSEQAGMPAHDLHATPDAIARLARNAGVKTLVLSHVMSSSLAQVEDEVRRIRETYPGEVIVAQDLQCLPIDG